MAFSSKTLQTLEFNKIIDMLVAATSTEGAKARAMSLTPSSDYDEIIMRQNKTDDAKRLITAKGYPAFYAGT